MKAIMVMYDSLNRKYLPNYGDTRTIAPNFERLRSKCVTFDTCYAGSIPCMPARRELHTGRYNFLHRDWGPLEPFDESMPEILQKNGIYSHLVSDHAHYWEDGGATYHTRFSSWEAARGQQGDHWKGSVKDPEIPEVHKVPMKPDGKTVAGVWRYDWVNREQFNDESDLPASKTFEMGLEFLERNHDADDWFLQIETFDPHEPFIACERFLELYEESYDGKHYDWPRGKCTETEAEIEHIRNLYRARVSFCDDRLGKVLDMMDEHDMWDDTMLIVNTDHGFLLSEHDFWGKNGTHMYEEVSHIPLFIWDPRSGKRNERRTSLVQTIDIAPTLLDYFDLPVPSTMQGRVLKDTIDTDAPIRDAALFGFYGEALNITDGRYVYMKAPEGGNEDLNRYTLVPMNIFSRFALETMHAAEFVKPDWEFLQGCPVMKVPGKMRNAGSGLTDELYDLKASPDQSEQLEDETIKIDLLSKMVRLMQESDAPQELYSRYGHHTSSC